MDTLFLERLLVLLARGSFTTTYKYALLLALIDLNLEGAGRGAEVTTITTRQLAERVVALYWPHTRPFQGRELSQSRAGQGESSVLRSILTFRRAVAPHDGLPQRAAKADPEGYNRLIDEVEWVFVREPIPRLQVIGGAQDLFLYRVEWTIQQNSGAPIDPSLPLLTRRAFRAGELPNVLRLLPGVHERLVGLAAVLRPLIHRQWTDLVAQMNRLPERALEDHLFGRSREDLLPVREPLWDLQGGRCFYCGGAVPLAQAQVDHVLPWSRFAEDAIENLVVADGPCNLSKRDFLAGREPLEPWLARPRRVLTQLAEAADWPQGHDRVRSTCAVAYRHMSPGMPLWRGRGALRGLSDDEQRWILAALMSPAAASTV
ncbi:MAG: HNH endonuclease [Deltaproteobacteria bacterium]|nr:HNH endonuclease [Deltaproteobacteria bacterium]